MNMDELQNGQCLHEKESSREDQLRLQAKVFEFASEGMMITDTKGRIISVNPAFTLLTGYAIEEVLGKSPGILHSGRHDTQFYINMWASIHGTGSWRGEIWNKRKSGEVYPEWLSINAIYGADGRIENYVGLFIDITDHKRSEEHLIYLAHYDNLTGLPNRTLLLEELADTIRIARRRESLAALLFIDLDEFKLINDNFGHAEGDILLREAAMRIKESIRRTDSVSRLAGDEFIVILPFISAVDDVVKVKNNILSRMHVPFQLGGQEINITASIGISVYPEDATNPEQLLHCADLSMYKFKKRRKEGIE